MKSVDDSVAVSYHLGNRSVMRYGPGGTRTIIHVELEPSRPKVPLLAIYYWAANKKTTVSMGRSGLATKSRPGH